MSHPFLEKLGKRVCVIGPRSAGKRTLSRLLSKRLGTSCWHLDQLYTTSIAQARSVAATGLFAQRHEELISLPTWVIEGTYTRTLNERLQYATTVILINESPLTCIGRLFLRLFTTGEDKITFQKFLTLAFSETLVNWPKERALVLEKMKIYKGVRLIQINNTAQYEEFKVFLEKMAPYSEQQEEQTQQSNAILPQEDGIAGN